jgi:hypothetical protein
MSLPELHPELVALRERELSLKAELHTVLYDLFVLEHDIFRDVTTQYREHFGEVEAQLQQATLRASEMQRRLELVVVRSRHGRVITREEMEHINAMVEREFSVYHRRMDDDKRGETKAKTAKRHGVSTAEPRSAEHVRERQSLYRQLVKVLHPDVTEDESLFSRFWSLVSDAYERDDLPRLRSLHSAICASALDSVDHGREMSYDDIRQSVDRLAMRVDYETRRYARLQTEEPYRLRTMLSDEQARMEHAASLRAMIERQERIIAAGAEQLRTIVGEGWESARMKDPDLKDEFDFQDDFLENTYFSMRA